MSPGERPKHHPHLYRHQGFTFVAVLALLFLWALAAQGVVAVLSTQAQRDRENTLLRVGSAYAQAIKAYYDATPGPQKQNPEQLDDLLLDRRRVGTQRYLRRLYADPLQADAPWGVQKDSQGRISGVYSTSDQAPMASGPIQRWGLRLGAASRYRDWVFERQAVQP